MRKIISIAIAAVIMCSVLAGSVCAGSGSTAKFKDVKDSDWFAEAVVKMNTMKIIDGMPGGSFNPKGEVTRAQFVKMLVQAIRYKKTDSVSFNDLKPFPTSKPHWACVYIETALRNGVISKDEIGENFFPDVPLTRKDMGMMMFRALKLTPSEGENPFVDITEANGYFTKLYEEYLIRGSIEGGKRLYKPEGLTTRAEAAVIIARMVEYKENPAEYVKTVGLETRIKEGTATEEDLKAKSIIDIAKQKADKNYIIEPIVKVEYNPSKIALVNIRIENIEDYSDDTQFKCYCTNNDEINIQGNTDMRNNYTEIDRHKYRPKKMVQNSIFPIFPDNIKVVGENPKLIVYDFDKGTQFRFKLFIKRGKRVKEFDIPIVTIQ